MKFKFTVAVLAAALPRLCTVAVAQTPAPATADPVVIKISRQALQVIGQGLQELPAKLANPVLNDLQAQSRSRFGAYFPRRARMPFQPDDIVRIVKVDSTTQIASYLGAEAIVISQHGDDPIYMIEIDVGRNFADRGGQRGPRFIVKEDYIAPDVTEKMIEAAERIVDAYREENPAMDTFGEAELYDIYRAMRAARFER